MSLFGLFKKAAEETQSAEQAVVEEAVATSSGGFFGRLKQGLLKTRKLLGDGLGRLILGRKQIDEELLEEIETALLTADVGVEATQSIIGELTDKLARKQLISPEQLLSELKQQLAVILQGIDKPLVIEAAHKPYVILMIGVNGAGKTTTIGKLAKRLQGEGKTVMLAAGDTFRAAAVEQLQVWGQRNNVPVIAQQTGADSASVIYDALKAAQARNIDVIIADTAGRLHTKSNLMEELKKVVRVMKKLDETAPHEVLLVLDASMGQNALQQAVQFQQALGVTGIAMTKLDGTAKGGVLFAIAQKLKLPIRFVGVGEKIDDLRPFAATEFVDALFGDE